jgi:hypothetical protein
MENIENHAVPLALLLIYIDFDRKLLKRSKSNSVILLGGRICKRFFFNVIRHTQEVF